MTDTALSVPSAEPRMPSSGSPKRPKTRPTVMTMPTAWPMMPTVIGTRVRPIPLKYDDSAMLSVMTEP